MSGFKLSLEELLLAASRKLREDFREIQACNPHAGERGAESEDILKRFLSERLPKRFGVESGVVVGRDDSVSRQSDVIIYDALNSPVYRTGPKLSIFPRDNVAAMVEVKSKLNKDELRDAAEKIAVVKALKASPISSVDQPVTFSDIIMTATLGCVFAFDSYTSLETLADNLKEINAARDSSLWVDLVVVLDKGILAYALQPIFSKEFIGWEGGALTDEFMIPPLYVHLVQASLGDGTLNNFFLRLMTHLTFFRKISRPPFESLLRKTSVQTIQGYQYNLGRQLVPAEPSHQSGAFQTPRIRFNLYSKEDRKYVGQVGLLRWQDGSVITCSSKIHPGAVFEPYLRRLNLPTRFIPGGTGNVNIWTSYVIGISEDEFISVSKDIHPELISVRDSPDENMPPLSI